MPDPTARPTTQTATETRPPRFVDELWRAVALDRLENRRHVTRARAALLVERDDDSGADADAGDVVGDRPARVVPPALRAAAVLELERRMGRVPAHVDELARRVGKRPGAPNRSKVGPKPASRGNRPSKRERGAEWSVEEIEAIAGGRPAEQMLAAMWPYLVGTAKGDQIRAAAEEVGVFGWIDGSATEDRPARLNGNQWSGKKHTPETKAKMAAARRAYWARRRAELS